MTASRDKIADLLWPRSDMEHSRNSLRQTLVVLRRELAFLKNDLLVSRHDAIGLDPDVMDFDVHRLLRGLASNELGDLEAAAAAYSGPFLDGYYSGSPNFDDWASGERARLVDVAVTVLERLTRRTAGETALRHARRLIAVDPGREASYRLNMELLAANGHRDGAMRAFEACKAALKREFGVEPSAETLRIRELIHSNGSDGATKGMASGPGERLGTLVSTRTSLGILRFSSLTGDREEDQISRALVQDIVTEISQHPEINVMTGAVPAGTHPDDLDVHQMKSLVNARYILTGALQRATNALRVNVRLVEIATSQTIWAERFDGDLRDLLAFQDRVTQSVAVAVRINLQLTTWRVHEKSPQGSPDVRRIVNQALTRYYEMTRESLLSAIDLSEQALQLEPANARAMRTESVAMTVSFSFGGLPKTTGNVEKALRLAEGAVRAVPDDEISRVVFSYALLCAGRNEEALAELGYAIDINPNYPSVYGDLAEQYALMGRTEEAMAAAHQALRLSSYDPLDFWRHYSILVAQFAAGHDQETLEVARKVVAVKPQFVTGALYLAAAAAATDSKREAARAIDLALTQLPNLSLRNVVPGVAQHYLQQRHHDRFIAMLRKAGLPP